MRLSPPIAISTLVAAALAAMAIFQKQDNRPSEELGCKIAQIAIEHEIAEVHQYDNKRKVAISDEPDDATFGLITLQKLAWSAEPDSRVQENVDIYNGLLRDGQSSPITRCASLLAYLESQKIPHGEHAVSAAIPGGIARFGDRLYLSSIIQISEPVISRDGKKAVVAIGRTDAPLSGGGKLLEFDIAGDSIKIVHEFHTWVS